MRRVLADAGCELVLEVPAKKTSAMEVDGTKTTPNANLVDSCWADQPAAPSAPMHFLPEKYAGQAVADKLTAIRQQLRSRQCGALLVTALDEVAWSVPALSFYIS